MSQKKRRAKKKKHPVLTAAALVLTAGAVWLAFSYFSGRARDPARLPYYETVMQDASAYRVSPALIYAVMRTESRFHPNAVSNAGAKGLMQVTDDTFLWVKSRTESMADIDESRLMEPEVNILAGVRTLSLLEEMFSSGDTVIAAYNAGPGTVQSWLQDPAYSSDGVTLARIPYPETEAYVRKVNRAASEYRSRYGLD